MVLRPEVVQAFNTLNINPDVDQATASKAYKRLALIHHPDRNHNDSTATQRFQEASLPRPLCSTYSFSIRLAQHGIFACVTTTTQLVVMFQILQLSQAQMITLVLITLHQRMTFLWMKRN